MSASEEQAVGAEDHAAEHHELPFWQRYIFSQDHKVIGLQYAFTALCFLLFGFCLMLIMRWQLAFPGRPVPIIGGLLGSANAPGGIMLPEFYNQLGAMHGTIMVFLAVVPLLVGAYGNYLVPLQIGAPDMAFPKLNMASYWCYLPGGLIMLASFFVPGGAANSGWTSYPPLSNIATSGQTWWLVGMVFLITSSLLGSVNFIVTIFQLRAEGLGLHASADVRLVTAGHLFLAPAGLPAVGGSGNSSTHGSGGRHQFLHAQRPGGQWRGPGGRWWWKPAAMAASILVPGTSRSLRVDPAGNGNRRGDHRQQHSQATLGLQADGLLRRLPRLHVVHRLGASHVPDRHGDGYQLLLSDHHDDHLRAFGGHPLRSADLALGRLHTVQHPDALCVGLSADVRYRWPYGSASGSGSQRHPFA